MPAPVIYVAVAVGTVAAVVAFKEFVYEPHIAPKFEAWAEAYVDRRRRARNRSHSPVAVPLRQNENEARRETGKKKRRSTTPDNDPMSVELENLVANEAAEWRSSAVQEGSLRKRKTHSVMEESNVFIPYDPMAPTQVLFDSSDSESPRSFKSPKASPSAASTVASPSPRAPASKSSTPPPTLLAQPNTLSSPRLLTPVSNLSPVSSRATSPAGSQMYHSASSASSFTPAVIGPQRSDSAYAPSRTASSASVDALSDAGHSVLSFPDSRVTSPFSDIHAARSPVLPPPAAPSNVRSPGSAAALSDTSSPLILSPNFGSEFELPSDTEEGMEGMLVSPSLRSGMFSPSVDLAREVHDDPFEVGSVHGSETESWDSFGRRSPEL